MNSSNLSQRLQLIANSIIKYAESPIRLADIGSDHAYLPNYLVLNHNIEFAVAGEVVDGPYHSALNEVRKNQHENIIDVRLGDGLEVVSREDRINTVAICGMGGILIRDILERGIDRLQKHHLLALQANTAEYQLRQWLMAENYQIIHEDLLEEKQHFYEIIIAKPVQNQTFYTNNELLFGPVLLQNKSPIFMTKWQKRLAKEQYILAQMHGAKGLAREKINQQRKLIETIERTIDINGI